MLKWFSVETIHKRLVGTDVKLKVSSHSISDPNKHSDPRNSSKPSGVHITTEFHSIMDGKGPICQDRLEAVIEACQPQKDFYHRRRSTYTVVVVAADRYESI